MKKFLLAFFILLFSCQTEQPCESFPFGTSLELSFGETLAHCTYPISITFLDLVSDSRCPAGVQCIWEGLVEVRISVTINGNESTFNLSSAPDFGGKIPKSKVVEGYVFQLENVLPYPKAGKSLEKKEKSLVLSIQKT